jgi:Uma2 family endonuclease
MDGDNPMRTALQPERRLTYDDFLLFPNDGRRHELIDGEHYVSPAPNVCHQRVVGRLYVDISNFLRQYAHVGEAFIAPTDVVLSLFDVVGPDIVFLAADQGDMLTDANVRGAPALAVEVVSPHTRERDEIEKYQLYARSGVREYWIVDPADKTVTICRRAPGNRLITSATLTADADDALTTPLLPGFSTSVRNLFA